MCLSDRTVADWVAEEVPTDRIRSLDISQRWDHPAALRCLAGCDQFLGLRRLSIHFRSDELLSPADQAHFETASFLRQLEVLEIGSYGRSLTNRLSAFVRGCGRLRHLVLRNHGALVSDWAEAAEWLRDWLGLSCLKTLTLGSAELDSNLSLLLPLLDSPYLRPPTRLIVQGFDDAGRAEAMFREALGRRFRIAVPRGYRDTDYD